MKHFSFKVFLLALGLIMNMLNANAANNTTELTVNADSGIETYAMILIGLGFMIFIASRRRND